MPTRTVRRSIALTRETRDLLVQLAHKQGSRVTPSDLIREAIRLYLERQEDVLSSRRHFSRTFQDRIERLEQDIAFHLNVLVHLQAAALARMLAHLTKERVSPQQLIQQAIIAARRDGSALNAQIRAVRDLPDEDQRP